MIVLVHGYTWGIIRCERLPYICFPYGYIGHAMKKCDDAPEILTEEQKENLTYRI